MRSNHNPHVGRRAARQSWRPAAHSSVPEISRQPPARQLPLHGCPAQKRARSSLWLFQRVYNICARTLAGRAGPVYRRQTEQIRWRMDILPLSTSWSMILSPSPSTSIARRDTKCFSDSLRCARPQINPPVRKAGNESCAFDALCVRSAHRTVRWKLTIGRVSSGRSDRTTLTT